MENKYPIKYAVLELKIDGDSSYNYEKVTVGYIVSKCYLIGQNLKFFSDGTSKVLFEVVFPYNDILRFKTNPSEIYKMEGTVPIIHKHDICANSKIVLDLFDTYDEAHAVANEMNNSYMNGEDIWAFEFGCSDNEKRQKALKKFRAGLIICSEYEKAIEDRTSDLIVDIDTINFKKLVLDNN